MANRRVTIEAVMNAEQARQTMRALGRDADILKQQNAAFSRAANQYQQRLFPGAGVNPKDPFRIDRFAASFSKAGNTLKVFNSLTSNTGSVMDLLGIKTVTFTGNVEQLTAAWEKYSTGLQQARKIHQQTIQDIRAIKQAQSARIAVEQTQVNAAVSRQIVGKGRLADLNALLTPYREDVRIARRDVAVTGDILAGRREGTATSAGYNAAVRRLEAAELALASATEAQAAERKAIRSEIRKAQAAEKASQAKVDAANLEYANARKAAAAAGRASILGLGLRGLRDNVTDAFNAAPGLPAVFQQLSGKGGSPELIRRLQRAGLGGGVGTGDPRFVQNLINQGAYDTFNIEKDLVRNVTRVTGSFTDQAGVLNRVTAEYDKSGRVITRFGSHMSGLGTILSQIGRDFQKVIEFAIATTVVFGSLRFAIDKIGTIIEIDKGLRQFAITANLTKEEARGLFEELSNIGIATATPLTEIVKAADDIALATREAGQSTREWQRDIISLTQSVGILTNLAGIDTVEATDQLVATMKQLNIEAQELPSILNKITAVAGGQSGAIADVIKGLGVLAEAGKQAGLSIDEMIGTVQTLSQVTSKSPAEVATALKQLIGALDGPAGSKALAQYNISLRDSAGNLRNIVDIYSEIQDKIRQGIIPADQVKGLVRAIAGGPRRAPDAAALLSSIGDIQQVTERSVNATNEALLANAKILDTVSAKVVQLQARFDKFATTTFAAVLEQGLTGLATVLDAVLSVMEGIPSEAYLIVLQFGLLAGAVKFASSIIGYSINSFRNLATSIQLATLELRGFNAQANATGQATRPLQIVGPVGPASGLSRTSRLAGLGRAVAPAVVAGGLIGGLSAASGADPRSAIGSGLQTAGLVGLLSPVTNIHPALKVASAAAIALGFALQFMGDQAQNSAPKVEGNTEELLNAISTYKELSFTLTGLTEEQADLGRSIDNLLEIENRTNAESQQLLDFQQQYAANAVEMINTNLALSDSFENLLRILKDFPLEGVGEFYLRAARAGALTQQQLQDLTTRLAPQVLKATNPNFVAPNEIFLPDPRNLGRFGAAYSDNPTASFGGFTPTAQQLQQNITGEGFSVNLREIQGNVDAVRNLFNDTQTSIRVAFDPAANNLDLFRQALESIKDSIPEDEFNRMLATFQKFAAENNALFAAQRTVALYQSYLDAGAATGLFTAEQVKNGTAILGLYQTLITLAERLPPESRGITPDGAINQRVRAQSQFTQQDAVRAATQFAFPGGRLRTEAPSAKEAREFGKAILEASGQLDNLAEKEAVMATIKQVFLEAGIAVRGFTTEVEVATFANSELLGELEKLANDGLSNVARRMAELQAGLQGGEFAENPEVFARQFEQQEAIARQLSIVKARYDALAESTINVDQVTQSLAGVFADIPGLIDAQSLTTSQLIARMFELADVYGLNGQQVDILGGKLVRLAQIISELTKYPAVLRLIADLDTTTAAKKLRALAKAAYATSGLATGDINQKARQQFNQYDAVADLLEELDSLGSDTRTLYGSGTGRSFYNPPASSGGSSGGRANGPDVSLIDIPDVIAQAYNRDALLQEAIRRARALQVLIPGATAEARDDIVELLHGTQRILEVRGTKDDLLRKALEELAEIEKKRLEQETEADTIRRIRVGAGDFAAIANVPVNARSGVSLGGPEGPINITLNLNGTVLTPAQFQQFADLVAAQIKRQLSG